MSHFKQYGMVAMPVVAIGILAAVYVANGSRLENAWLYLAGLWLVILSAFDAHSKNKLSKMGKKPHASNSRSAATNSSTRKLISKPLFVIGIIGVYLLLVIVPNTLERYNYKTCVAESITGTQLMRYNYTGNIHDPTASPRHCYNAETDETYKERNVFVPAFF